MSCAPAAPSAPLAERSPSPTASAVAESPSPTATPTPTALHATPAKGALVFEAKLDGTASDLRSQPTKSGDESASSFRFAPGFIELSLVRDARDSYVRAFFNTAPRQTFVGELDLSFTPGSTSIFEIDLRDEPQGAYRLRVFADREVVELRYVDFTASPPVGEALTPTTPIPGLQSGRTFTLAAVVELARITLFLDEKPVLQASDARLSRGTIPYVTLFQRKGTAQVKGARFYELPPAGQLPGALAAASAGAPAPIASRTPSPAPAPEIVAQTPPPTSPPTSAPTPVPTLAPTPAPTLAGPTVTITPPVVKINQTFYVVLRGFPLGTSVIWSGITDTSGRNIMGIGQSFKTDSNPYVLSTSFETGAKYDTYIYHFIVGGQKYDPQVVLGP